MSDLRDQVAGLLEVLGNTPMSKEDIYSTADAILAIFDEDRTALAVALGDLLSDTRAIQLNETDDRRIPCQHEVRKIRLGFAALVGVRKE